MKILIDRICSGIVAALLFAVLQPASASPALGVYEGAGCTGVKQMATFELWAGAPPARILDFIAIDSWKSVEGESNWASGCWDKSPYKNIPITITVPLNTQETTIYKNPRALADVAAGAHDDTYRKVFAGFVKNGLGKATLRFGHEMNGGWYPWAASGHEKDFAAAFAHVVTVARSTPGAQFKFDWCPAGGNQQTTKYDEFYPGDEFVDVVGMDIYAIGPWGHDKPDVDLVWATLNKNYTLDWLPYLGRIHSKPIVIDEWGIGDRPDGKKNYGPGDSAELTRKMLDWMTAHDVQYAVYWDYNAGDYNSMVSNGQRPGNASVLKPAFERQKSFTAPLMVPAAAHS